MSSKKCLIISILSAISLTFLIGCGGEPPREIPALSVQGEGGGEDTVTVYVLTKYELTEVVVGYGKYSSWLELIGGEFDGDGARAHAVWRGDYVASIGNLRPDDPSEITVYLNGVYSNYFVRNCEYRAGYTLSFVEKGAKL